MQKSTAWKSAQWIFRTPGSMTTSASRRCISVITVSLIVFARKTTSMPRG